MAVKELGKDERAIGKKLIKMYGQITKISNNTNMDTSTVKRIINSGQGEEEKVDALSAYLKTA